jgi:hypothetical protein
VTTPIDHPSSTGQTTCLPEDGPASSVLLARMFGDQETRALPGPGRRRSFDGIENSSAYSGSTNQKCIRERRGSRSKRSA